MNMIRFNGKIKTINFRNESNEMSKNIAVLTAIYNWSKLLFIQFTRTAENMPQSTQKNQLAFFIFQSFPDSVLAANDIVRFIIYFTNNITTAFSYLLRKLCSSNLPKITKNRDIQRIFFQKNWKQINICLNVDSWFVKRVSVIFVWTIRLPLFIAMNFHVDMRLIAFPKENSTKNKTSGVQLFCKSYS